MKPKNEQIKMCLEDLDLKLIYETIKSNGWTLLDTESKERKVPTLLEVQKAAEKCMREAFKSDNKIARHDRFEAEVNRGVLSIKFVLTQASPLISLFN